MGTFIGHVIPGVFFIALASWWMMDTLRSYFCRVTGRFRSRIVYSSNVCGRRVPVMAYTLITLGVIGILVALVFTPVMFKTFPKGHNLQHATMYSFYAMVGIVSLISKCVSHFPFQRQAEYIALTYALIVQAVLFHFHLHGRIQLDIAMHRLLNYTIFAAIIVTIFEMKHDGNVLFSLGRSYFIILQGMWFIQVGFTLFNPLRDPWGYILNDVKELSEHSHGQHDNTSENVKKPNNETEYIDKLLSHDAVMNASTMYCWHAGILLLVCGTIFVICYNRSNQGQTKVTADSENGNCKFSLLANEDASDA